MRHEHVMDGLFARGTARPPTESRALTGRSVAMPRTPTHLHLLAEAEANDVALWPQQQDFKEWLLEVSPDKLKIRQSVFSERLVPR